MSLNTLKKPRKLGFSINYSRIREEVCLNYLFVKWCGFSTPFYLLNTHLFIYRKKVIYYNVFVTFYK